MKREYKPTCERNRKDWAYVQAALAIGHSLEQIASNMPHNPTFVQYCKRNGWL